MLLLIKVIKNQNFMLFILIIKDLDQIFQSSSTNDLYHMLHIFLILIVILNDFCLQIYM